MNPYRGPGKLYIGGIWRDGSSNKVLVDSNPYNGEKVAEFRLANRTDIDEAYRAAERAQREWERINPYRRRDILEGGLAYLDRHEAEITEIIIEELGGTRLKAAFEIGLVRTIIKEAATYPLRMVGRILPSIMEGKENRLYRVPAGVVSVISPFNFPFFLSMRSVAAALGAGNGVVLKPHDDTMITGGVLVAKVFEEAGLPPGLLNVVNFDLGEVGDAFLDHPTPRIVSFTGSDSVGRHIASVAGRNLKKAILELGGNSALIVLDDADLERAVHSAVFSRFTHQGQICMSANRVLVQRGVYPQFLDRYIDVVAKLVVGDPRDPRTHIGPLINRKQAENLARQIEAGIAEGARPALRGAIEATLAAPTILADVTASMSVAKEEIFGPCVCVMPFRTVDEAVAIANDSRYGLSGAIHTRDPEQGARLAQRIDSAAVHVNDGTILDEPAVAFGGIKDSGIGRLNGKWGLDELTNLKWISVQHEPPRYPFEAPPSQSGER